MKCEKCGAEFIRASSEVESELCTPCLIDSLKQENEELHQRQLERYLPCPDCRDKVKDGECLRCKSQKLRERVEELENELEVANNHNKGHVREIRLQKSTNEMLDTIICQNEDKIKSYEDIAENHPKMFIRIRNKYLEEENSKLKAKITTLSVENAEMRDLSNSKLKFVEEKEKLCKSLYNQIKILGEENAKLRKILNAEEM